MTKDETERRILVLEKAVIKLAMWVSLLSGGQGPLVKEASILIKEVAGGE